MTNPTGKIIFSQSRGGRVNMLKNNVPKCPSLDRWIFLSIKAVRNFITFYNILGNIAFTLSTVISYYSSSVDFVVF